MSKVTDEQVEAAAKAFEIDRYANPSSFKSNMRAALEAVIAALEAASSTPDGEAARESVISAMSLELEKHEAFSRRPVNSLVWATRLYDAAPYPAPIKDGVTVKALEWGSERRYGFLIHEGRGAGYTYEAAAKAYGPGWIVTLDLTTIFDGPDADEAEAKAAAQADFAARVKSFISHNAGEIEAGGEVGEPTRYDMVKMTGSLTLLPAVRADGEWVRYADHEASIASAIAGFDRLAATQNGIVHQITARAEAADKLIAELTAALGALDGACDALAASRGQATYLSMIDNDLAAPLLLELDAARSAARAALKESRL